MEMRPRPSRRSRPLAPSSGPASPSRRDRGPRAAAPEVRLPPSRGPRLGTALPEHVPPRGCWGRPGKWAPGRAWSEGRGPDAWPEAGARLLSPAPLPHLPEARHRPGGRTGPAPSAPGRPSPAGGLALGQPRCLRARPGSLRVCGGEGTGEAGQGGPLRKRLQSRPEQQGLRGRRGSASRTLPPSGTGPKARTPT